MASRESAECLKAMRIELSITGRAASRADAGISHHPNTHGNLRRSLHCLPSSDWRNVLGKKKHCPGSSSAMCCAGPRHSSLPAPETCTVRQILLAANNEADNSPVSPPYPILRHRPIGRRPPGPCHRTFEQSITWSVALVRIELVLAPSMILEPTPQCHHAQRPT